MEGKNEKSKKGFQRYNKRADLSHFRDFDFCNYREQLN
jgi:hypothetical protein